MLVMCAIGILACQNEPAKKDKDYTGPLFQQLTPSDTKIGFRNSITETLEFNFVNYLNIYNGGGVAIGDINNDGLQDIYFTSNQQSNKLYLNKGDMVFDDITSQSGTSDSKGWTTGVTMVDINGDGLLDIYVCKSASMNNPELRKNKLFINQGDNQFAEQAAQYGLDDASFSNQAYFFDYDNDNDLDMYLVNHRTDWQNTVIMSAEVQRNIIYEFSDKLYRNDGGRFTDVTAAAGLINKTWGHAAAINDFNEDGYLDIFVSNDFLEPDHLYINNGKGGFTDEIRNYFDHISYYSMGSDVADINNDGLNDLMVLDMVPDDHVRSKRNMPGMSSEQFHTMVRVGYHHQYMVNILQLNHGGGRYSEISNLAGVSNTDWSWAPVFADFDNDGLKDLFITNGIKRDMTDNDYKNKLNELNATGRMSLEDVFAIAPGTKIRNYAYKNNGDGSFEDVSKSWGLDENLNSNGVAYGDLDNDGDLDLVVNNLEDFASVYENKSTNNSISVKLKGPEGNALGLGSKILVEHNGTTQLYEQFTNRGILSSVSPYPVIGIGDSPMVESVNIIWPDGKSQTFRDVKANRTLEVDYTDSTNEQIVFNRPAPIARSINPAEVNLSEVMHTENEYDDFETEILLPHKLSTLGPKMSQADINGDGLTDFYFGGARNQPGKIAMQNKDGSFTIKSGSVFESHKSFEDIGSLFFDADGDEDMDLYVVSGSNERDIPQSGFQDRLYLNDGNGNFIDASSRLPKITQSGSVVRAADIDQDGDQDLFVGGRVIPGKYPLPADSYLLENQNGRFVDITDDRAADLRKLGLVTDARFSDYNNDGDLDLIVVGEWMPMTIFDNTESGFLKNTYSDISGIGWWYSVTAADLDGDGDDDYILGNLGLNNKFGARKEKPFHVFCNDFDGTGNLDIVLSKESKGKLLPVRGRECSSQQMPFIADKFPTYNDFATADLQKIYGEEKLDEALHYQATNFESAILINDNGKFLYKKMPTEAQYGPSQATIVTDINNDGHVDIIGAGSIFNAEVETIRYDGLKGYILLGDGKGNFNARQNSGFITKGNVKDLAMYDYNNKKRILVAVNNGPVELFEI